MLCAQDLLFKFPNDEAREKFISAVIKPYQGARDPETNDLVLRDRVLDEDEAEGILPPMSQGTWLCQLPERKGYMFLVVSMSKSHQSHCP